MPFGGPLKTQVATICERGTSARLDVWLALGFSLQDATSGLLVKVRCCDGPFQSCTDNNL